MAHPSRLSGYLQDGRYLRYVISRSVTDTADFEIQYITITSSLNCTSISDERLECKDIFIYQCPTISQAACPDASLISQKVTGRIPVYSLAKQHQDTAAVSAMEFIKDLL
eukprot:IDg16343t1